MSTFSARKFMYRLVAAAALVSLTAAGSTLVRAADDDVPQNVRDAIETVLKDKVKSLSEEKDSSGVGYKRGTYSKIFHRIDDSTYAVAFTQDTIEPAPDNASAELKTERFEFTIKKDASGAWKIAKQDLKDSFIGLYEPYVSRAQIYKFDTLSFDKEGLKVSASHGYAFAEKLLDKTVAWRVFADDLKFDYLPPADATNMNYYQALATKLAREHPEDIVFKPEWAQISCDPVTCDGFAKAVFGGLTRLSGDEVTALAKSGSGPAARMLKDRGDAGDKADKELKDNPFGYFRRLPDPDRRRWRFLFKRDGFKEHYSWVTYDNFAPWQVLVGASTYGNIYGYYSQDIREAKLDPHVLEERDDLNARDYELEGLDGTVSLGLDDPTAMSGDITYTIHIKRQITVLPFFIAHIQFGEANKATTSPKLFINALEDDKGNDLTWTRLGSMGGLIYFPKPVEAGTVMKLRLQFLNYNAIYQLNPSFFGMSRSGWLPFVRFTDQIKNFALTTKVLSKYTLLGIGQRVSESVDGDVRTERWVSPSPVTFPTLIFGRYISDNAGKYQAKKLDGTVIPVNVYVDTVSTNQTRDTIRSEREYRDEVAARNAGARGIRPKQLRAVATDASVALNIYTKLYDVDYPFAKLDLVLDPLGFLYGQSPSSLVYLGWGVFRGEGEIIDYTSRSASQLSKFNKDVVAHETAHQWWGSLVSNANQRNYWFVESMAELSSAIYVEKVYGRKKYDEKVADWRKNVLDNDPLSTVQNSYELYPGDTGFGAIQANIYNKGPYAFHIFRETFGDKKFYQLLKTMAQKFAHKEIVTQDIEDVMEEVVGGNMDWFFDQWIRGVGIPQYAIFWTKRQNEKGQWIVEGTVKQRVVFGKDKTLLKGVYYRGVAPLTFVDANGKEYKSPSKLLVQGPETPFRVIIGIDPLKVYFNKDNEILALDELVNQNW